MTPEKLRELLFEGAVLAIQLTPFKSGYELDLEGLRENTRFLVERGRQGRLVLVPCGGQSEHYAMADEERKRVVKTVVDAAGGRVPVIAGTGHSGTEVAAEHSRYARDVGADGVMVILPYYLVPSEEGLYQHFKRVAEASGIGMVVYNNPDASKIYVRPRLMKRIAQIPEVVGVKENTPSIQTFYEQVQAVGDRVPILSGRGEFWFIASALLGARGYASGYANLMPEFTIDLLKAGLEGNFDKLRKFLKRLQPLGNFVSRMNEKYGPTTTILPHPYTGAYMLTGVLKATMDMLGLHGGRVRLPIQEVDEEDREELREIIFDQMGLSRLK